MARISQQTKDGLIVITTIGIGIATGFFVDEWTKNENYAVSLILVIALGVVQLGLVFVSSQEMADLEEYRNEKMNELRWKNAIAQKALKLVEEGKLDEAVEWHRVGAESLPGRESK